MISRIEVFLQKATPMLTSFQIINLLILTGVAVVLVLYAWRMWTRAATPKAWTDAIRKGSVGPALLRAKRHYPDPIRFYTFWLQAERLRKSAIPGAYAEVGVYKGQTASVLFRMDPSRDLHLFDTFSGFPAEDLHGERGKAAAYSTRDFADTRLSRVLKRIDGGVKVIPHPGYFPDTAGEADGERFALVSIDADLYKPTLAALQFFYPRMSPGGVILVHDYHEEWEGVMRAVDEFTATIPEVPVRIPDINGTLLIIKE